MENDWSAYMSGIEVFYLIAAGLIIFIFCSVVSHISNVIKRARDREDE